MQTYVVSSGDTLYGIASKYGVSVNDIKTANNVKNNNLSIGQILKIPTIETVALYIVKKGDSLYSIAKSYDTTVDELIKLNNLKSNSLSVGQQLKLPINGNVSDGEYVVVEKVRHEILEAPITVYNFEVEDYHTYYVAASADSDLFVLVHNRCGTSYELSDNQLRNFGHKGKNSGYRVTHGSHENAMDFVLTQTNGLIEYSPGKYVGYK